MDKVTAGEKFGMRAALFLDFTLQRLKHGGVHSLIYIAAPVYRAASGYMR